MSASIYNGGLLSKPLCDVSEESVILISFYTFAIDLDSGLVKVVPI